MQKLVFCILAVLFFQGINGQGLPQVRFIQADTLSIHLADGKGEGRLGGISAMEYHGPDSLLLISDHDGSAHNSFLFVLNNNKEVTYAGKYGELKNTESVRFSPVNGDTYFAFESKNSTGVGWVNDGKQQMLFSEKIPEPGITSDNRGIEGICFTPDSSLWVAFESGDTVCGGGYVPFYRFRPAGDHYNFKKGITYKYPIDPCRNLLRPVFNGTLGNGISEILAYGEDSRQLLVLERSYNGVEASVLLMLVTVPDKGDIMTKDTLLNFSDPRVCGAFQPDNLEAMCWGPVTDSGGRILYLMSDDNFSSRQATQLVTLEVISGKLP